MIFESPTNPANKVADLAALTRLARAHGVLTLMDNTFAGPHQHGQFDIDVFLHSLTKFAAGHGDVMGGAVIANATLIERMKRDFILFGGVLDPHAAFLIQRGLKTYFVRYRAQCANAQRIAELLEQHPSVENVRYPGLASHGQHLLARAQMSEFGAVVSFDLKAGAEAGQRFAEALELFAITASLGATDSLVIPPQLMGGREFNAEQRRISGIAAGTIRLSIGLEDIDDLLADISQALVAANVGVVRGP
jgi:cystathionine beta-lyase/cystathionine gamma-synthase